MSTEVKLNTGRLWYSRHINKPISRTTFSNCSNSLLSSDKTHQSAYVVAGTGYNKTTTDRSTAEQQGDGGTQHHRITVVVVDDAAQTLTNSNRSAVYDRVCNNTKKRALPHPVPSPVQEEQPN